MKISASWIREFVDLKVNDQQLAQDLTMHGTGVEGMSQENGDTVFEVEFTSNRPDAMNHYGVARECSAIYDVDLKPLTVQLPGMAMAAIAGADLDSRPERKPGKQPAFVVEIEDGQGCARYTARVVRGITIGPSPQTIAQRLMSVEQRPINNVADASNYVLWEMGHPTHAFDMDLLEGGKIVVRRARDGEILKTLDGVERKLGREDLVIADARKPVALAGVMGGFDTMITEKTRNVLIESAWFDPAAVRKTAKRRGMHTDASHRFERGADYAATPLACARVAQFILASAGGKLDGEVIDAVARTLTPASIALRRSEVRRILGKEIGEAEIERILRRLGFTLRRERLTVGAPLRHPAPPMSGGMHAALAEEPTVATAEAPSWRLDVEREIDVIEEIARIHGYDTFPNTLPAFSGAVIENPDERKDARLRTALLAMGYNEAMSWTFIGREDAEAFASGRVLPLENPISEEVSVMRTSLLPGMLQMLGWNLNRGNNDVRLFEAGHVFSKAGERVEEKKRISLGATGSAEPGSWDRAARPYGFFDMKGDIEELLGAFASRSVYYDQHAAEWFHPGRSARAVMDGVTVAQFGQLHPDVADARKLRQDVFIGEIYLDRLYEHRLHEPRYAPIPRFPAIGRDFSFVFENAVTFERISSIVNALQIQEMRSFRPAEVFRGGSVPEGKYSVLLRAEFLAPDRTLRDDEVAVWAQQIIKALEAVGGVLRS